MLKINTLEKVLCVLKYKILGFVFSSGFKSAQPKTENDSNGGKSAPYSHKKVNHFFIGYNKTIGVRSGPGFFKTKIKKI